MNFVNSHSLVFAQPLAFTHFSSHAEILTATLNCSDIEDVHIMASEWVLHMLIFANIQVAETSSEHLSWA